MEDWLRILLIAPKEAVHNAVAAAISAGDDLMVVETVEKALEVFCIHPLDVIFINMDRSSLASAPRVKRTGNQKQPFASIVAESISTSRAVAALDAGATDVLVVGDDEEHVAVGVRAALKRAKIYRRYLNLSEIVAQKEKELAHLKAVLHELTIQDQVTGVYTYEYFSDALSRNIEAAHRHGTSLVLVHVTITEFGTYTDAAGEDGANDLLKRVAETLKVRLRKSDIVARYGRNGFIICLQDMAVSEAVDLVPTLKRRIMENMNLPQSLDGVVIPEMRVAGYPDNAASAKALIDAVMCAAASGCGCGTGGVKL